MFFVVIMDGQIKMGINKMTHFFGYQQLLQSTRALAAAGKNAKGSAQPVPAHHSGTWGGFFCRGELARVFQRQIQK